MNKEWFVFKGTHHLGPFSVEEIEEFFHSGEINLHTLIWKEGNEKWLPISKILTFEFLFTPVESEELPPPLPPLPPIQHIPSLPTPPHVGISDDELPPPIPLDAIIDPRGEVRLRIKSDEQNNRFSKYALIIGSIAFAFIVGWYALTQKEASIQLRIKGIMPVYLERLEMTATKNTPRFEVAMALSLDGLTLWGSTNLDGEISTVIKMNSVPRKVLGLEDVALVVKGDFVNHVAKFNKMVLIQGSKFLPGEYQIHAEGRQTHFINRHFKSLSAIPFFKSLNKSFSYDGTTLIYPGTPREFEKRLVEYSSTILNEKLKPFQDKLERLMTLESILNTTSQNFLMELEKAKTGKSIQSFEEKFMKEVSPLLQSLVVRANELSNEPKYSDEEKSRLAIAPYRVQVQLGKQIGEMASDMITKTEKFKKLTDKDKSALRTEFDNRARGIKLQIDMNIKILEEQIQ
ncbi:MAG: DUF4339 domain-containing protein, partial [Alphaproteobacteria bacterium]